MSEFEKKIRTLLCFEDNAWNPPVMFTETMFRTLLQQLEECRQELFEIIENDEADCVSGLLNLIGVITKWFGETKDVSVG